MMPATGKGVDLEIAGNRGAEPERRPRVLLAAPRPQHRLVELVIAAQVNGSNPAGDGKPLLTSVIGL